MEKFAHDLWQFVSDPTNQATLAWIGGGLVAVATGIWAVVKFRLQGSDKAPPPPPSQTATASDHSLAAGRDAKGNTINITHNLNN